MSIIIEIPTDAETKDGVVQVIAELDSVNFDPTAIREVPFLKTGKTAIITEMVFIRTNYNAGPQPPAVEVQAQKNAGSADLISNIQALGLIISGNDGDVFHFPTTGKSVQFDTDSDVINLENTTARDATVNVKFLGYYI